MNIILALHLFFAPLQAPLPSSHQILIYGQDFPMLFLLSYTKEHATMTLYTLPTNTLYYDPVERKMQSLQELQAKKEEEQLMQLLASSHSFDIENVIYVETDAIERHFDTIQDMRTIASLYDMQRYFADISEQISFQDIWHIFDFVESDLSLMELYDLYQQFNRDTFSLQYSFPNLIATQEYWIPVAKHFSSIP